MRRLLLACAVTIIFICDGSACTCDYNGNFLEVSEASKLVVLVKVKGFPVLDNLFSRTNVAMEVEIIKVYRGNESRRRITVWGDNGSLCRPYVSEFTPGRQYLLALQSGSNNSGNTFESDSDYSISGCGEYWLPLQSSGNYHFILTGKKDERKEYSLKDFEIELRKRKEENQ